MLPEMSAHVRLGMRGPQRAGAMRTRRPGLARGLPPPGDLSGEESADELGQSAVARAEQPEASRPRARHGLHGMRAGPVRPTPAYQASSRPVAGASCTARHASLRERITNAAARAAAVLQVADCGAEPGFRLIAGGAPEHQSSSSSSATEQAAASPWKRTRRWAWPREIRGPAFSGARAQRRLFLQKATNGSRSAKYILICLLVRLLKTGTLKGGHTIVSATGQAPQAGSPGDASGPTATGQPRGKFRAVAEMQIASAGRRPSEGEKIH